MGSACRGLGAVRLTKKSYHFIRSQADSETKDAIRCKLRMPHRMPQSSASRLRGQGSQRHQESKKSKSELAVSSHLGLLLSGAVLVEWSI